MGSYMSCTLSTPLINNSKAARVIFPGGEVRQFRQPVKAAELMFECPNFFLTNSQSLHIGRRFSALGADEEIEFGNVYIMVPMKRVNSVVTGADLAAFFIAANSAAKRISGGGDARIRPEGGVREVAAQNGDSSSEAGGSRLISSDEDNGILGAEFRYRLAVCRSRKPTLETIKEEPMAICSR